MRHRTFRIRRAALTLMVGASAVAGTVASGLVTGTAQATTPVVGSMSASGTPAITSTGSNQSAGSLTLTIASGTTLAAGDVIDLVVSDSGTAAGNGTICFNSAGSASSSGINIGTPVQAQSYTACPSSVGGKDTIQIPITTTGTLSGTGTISLTGLAYDTGNATGTLGVYGYLDSSSTDLPPGTTAADVVGLLSPTSGVANGTLPPTPPAAPTTLGVTAATSPTIGVGLANQAAGNLAVTLTAGGSAPTSEGWQSGYLVAVEVWDTNGTASSDNCSGNDFVGFAATGTPTVTTSNWGSAAAPSVTATRAYITPCGSSVANELLLTFGNTGTFPQSTSSFTITVPGIQYTTGTATPAGPITVGANYENTSGAPQGTASVTPSNATAPSGPSDAVVSTAVVTANSPAVNVSEGSINTPISPVTVTEATPGAVSPGWVCVTLGNTAATTFAPSSGASGTNAFDAASTPKVAVTSGPGTVNSTASFETVGSGTTDNTVAFQVTTQPPETSASTYQISGLGVDSGSTSTPGPVLAMVTTGVSSATNCPATSGSTSSTLVAYTVAAAANRTYGANADATAAAELYSVFNYQNTSVSDCPGTGGTSLTGTYSASRPVVLATDTNYPDALDGSYLAADLHTGELLTPINSLSAPTLQALRLEGISQVYVVGGPYVVSNAVVTQLQNTPVYSCGGQTPVTTLLGTAQDITVTRIYGQTEYDTAAQIAEFAGANNVGKLSFTGAYAGTNSSGGTGAYNDTSGNASATAASSAAVPTAIVATGQGYQDAESASVLSYADSLPILLTTPGTLSPQTKSALQALGIQQVIVMGGPLAVSDAVVTSIENLGISVLRIAGQVFTDTSVQLADFEMNTAGVGLGWTPHGDLYVARGDFYSDGLAGAVETATNAAGGNASCTGGNNSTSLTPYVCANNPVPLMLTRNPSTVGQHLTAFLNQAGTTGIDNLSATKVSSLNILGGPLAVSDATVSTMNADLAG